MLLPEFGDAAHKLDDVGRDRPVRGRRGIVEFLHCRFAPASAARTDAPWLELPPCRILHRCCIYLTPAWLALCADRRTIGRCSAASALWPNLSALRLRCHFNFRCLQKRPLTMLAPGPVCPPSSANRFGRGCTPASTTWALPAVPCNNEGRRALGQRAASDPSALDARTTGSPVLINRQTFGCRWQPGSVVGTGPCDLQSPLLLGALLHSQGGRHRHLTMVPGLANVFGCAGLG